MLTTLLTAAIMDSTGTLPFGFSGPLLTWTGLILFIVLLMLSGRLIPKSTHEREIRILEESHAKVVAGLQAQVLDKTAEITVWRDVSTVKESTVQELLAQHRLSLDSTQSMVRSFDQIRAELAARSPKGATSA